MAMVTETDYVTSGLWMTGTTENSTYPVYENISRNVSTHIVPFSEIEKKLLDHGEFRLNRYLLLIIPPMLLVLGTVGNLLALVVLLRPPMRKTSTYMFLAMLGATDLLVLYASLLPRWMDKLPGPSPMLHTRRWACRTATFVNYSASHYSSWLVVAVTVERYIAVVHPLRATCWCNRRRAWRVMGILLLLAMTANLHHLWTVDVCVQSALGMMTSRCKAAPAHRQFVMYVWPWLDLALYSMVPFSVVLTLNIFIIRSICRARHMRRNTLTQHGNHVINDGSDIRLTTMLLCVSFTFLLLIMPVNIEMVIRSFWYKNPPSTYKELGMRWLQISISRLIMYTNHSVNFFLYCATGQRFRRELRALLCCRMTSHQRCMSKRSVAGSSRSLHVTPHHPGNLIKLHPRPYGSVSSFSSLANRNNSPA